MKNTKRSERAKRKVIYSGLAVFLTSCVLFSLIYPSIKQANADVVFLRTTFPASQIERSDIVDSESEISGMPVLEDPEARLIQALQKDDIDVAYDKMEDRERWQVVRMRVTGYCSCPKCCGKFSDGMTASCHRIHKGDVFVAADKHYRFGTEMIIPGYNQTQPVEVLDRGRVIKGKRLDVYFDSHRQAQEWGVQYLDVLVKISK